MIVALLQSKPVLVGAHLALAIIGIDAYFWVMGEIFAHSSSRKRILFILAAGIVGFLGSWIAGGYYYVKYYGVIVKPLIKAGSAPWAHAVVMEAKEHIFLFVIPLALTAFFAAMMKSEELDSRNLRKPLVALAAFIAVLGLSLGLMGFIISATARWMS